MRVVIRVKDFRLEINSDPPASNGCNDINSSPASQTQEVGNGVKSAKTLKKVFNATIFKLLLWFYLCTFLFSSNKSTLEAPLINAYFKPRIASGV